MMPRSQIRSVAARWSRRLAVFAVPLGAITTLLHRFGGLDTPTALFLLGLCMALALLALIVGSVALAQIWRRGDGGAGDGILGVALALAILAWPAWLLTGLATRPQINDVTTDWTDPPSFQMAAEERSETANPATYPGRRFGELQAAAYPELVPFFLGYSATLVFDAAVELIEERGWRILAAERPEFGGAGRIEAVAQTPVFGFEDDVSIRITPRGAEQTRVDMRSASRYGRHDLGANADRIFAFLNALKDRLENPLPAATDESGILAIE